MNSRIVFTILIYCFSLLFLSCKDKSERLSASEPAEVLSKEIPQDFIQFYLKFFADTSYQKEHIVFPLKMQSDGQPWTAEDWTYHKPFNDEGGFQQEFLNMKGLILETISDPKGMYKMERRYMKSGDAYELIYFTVMNAFENSDDWESTSQ